MASANPNYTDILATTIESRSSTVQDNFSNNTALLYKMKKRGNVRPFSGGHKIIEPLSFQENSNGGFFSGYDPLPVAATENLTAAEYNIKQYAVAVTASGLEMAQNSGSEAIIDMLEAKLSVAEGTALNDLSASLYSSGTGSGGKEITGLGAAVSATPSTGTYGGINRADYTFWRNYFVDTGAAPSSATIQGILNTAWANLVRNNDHPDLIVMDNTTWAAYMASLQAIQRFTSTELADLGFTNVKFMNADVVLDGGIGGSAPSVTALLLNTKYLHWRPHSKYNMTALGPEKRYAVNQDAVVQILGWYGNLTCSGAKFQGRIQLDA